MADYRELVNRVLDGKLDDILASYRDDAGMTYDEIASALLEEHTINVSRETVRRWLNESDDAA